MKRQQILFNFKFSSTVFESLTKEDRALHAARLLKNLSENLTVEQLADRITQKEL